MTKKDLRRAAFFLREWADVIRTSNEPGGNADSDAAMIEAKEMADLSRKLYALAREPKSIGK